MSKKLVLILVLIVSTCLPGFSFAQAARMGDASNARKVANALSEAFEDAATRITPSLVSINSLTHQKPRMRGMDPRVSPFRDFLGDELFEHYFRSQPEMEQPGQQGQGGLQQHGMGSGFIISKDGYILTNNHVIADADKVRVRLNDKREVDAEVVGTDPQTDIAVVKINVQDIVPAELGNSNDLGIGEWVLAAGNPFGLDRTITAGIVSARGRSVSYGDKYESFIQTDAAINVGNSGGPLVNLDGEVVGINTMILSKSGGNHGIGFAIPINMAKNISQQLIQKGTVTRGWLGIAIQDLSEDLKSSFNFDGNGVLVGDVNTDGPADKGGLLSGDIILAVNDVKTPQANDLRNRIAAIEPGSNVKLKVLRNGSERLVSVTLGERPGEPELKINTRKSESTRHELGMQLQDLTSELKSRTNVKSEGSVLVVNVEPYSAAFNAGIRKGDVILKVDNNDLKSTSEFVTYLDSADLGKGVRLVLESEGMKRFAVLKK